MHIKYPTLLKIFFLSLLLCLLGTGCDKYSENWEEQESSEKEVLFLYKPEKVEMNLLEITDFSIVFEESASLAQIQERYDRLEWVVQDEEGEQYSFTLMNAKEFTFKWGHCFYYPGTFKSYLLGVKNERIVYQSDTVTLKISNTKDFLRWNWNEFPDKTISENSFVNILDPDFELAYFSLDNPDQKGICVYLLNSEQQDEDIFSQEAFRKLYNYMEELYGEPVVDKESADLNTMYEAEFSYQYADAQPLAIWKTSKSRIVLLEVQKEWKSIYLFAEPL
ncbi:MAG: hypothetical protein SOR57_06065 [Parabacteroides sp.]|nr:hypothetical protein [Parabacteroides sp.]